MSTLMTVLGGNLLGSVKDLIGEFHLSAEDKAKFQAAVDANAAVVAQKQIDLQEKYEETRQSEVQAASANIRAEMATGDKYTQRARPSFIYFFLLIMLNNYALLPWAHRDPVTLPNALFYLFGTAIGGYVLGRSWEKISASGQGA